MTTKMKIADIVIGKRHREDMGDLDAMAESITLVYGYRGLMYRAERRSHQ